MTSGFFTLDSSWKWAVNFISMQYYSPEKGFVVAVEWKAELDAGSVWTSWRAGRSFSLPG